MEWALFEGLIWRSFGHLELGMRATKRENERERQRQRERAALVLMQF